MELLELADDAAARGDAGEGRTLVLAARRLALLSAPEAERSLRARALREEAHRLAPWRRRAIRKLLPSGERVSPEAVYLAAAIRDEEEPPGDRTGWRIRASVAGALVLGVALGLAGAAAVRGPSGATIAGGAAGVAGGAAVALAALAAARRRSGR